MKVGVLGLQGDVREHLRALTDVGAAASVVKKIDQLDAVDALIIPGGESTTIGKLLDLYGLIGPLRERARAGMPLYGTCAGAILMADRVVGLQDAPHRLGVMDISVRRNAYGRQVDSFETDLTVSGIEGSFRAVFIRAPSIEQVGDDVEVLATVDDQPVLVRQGALLASTFHPEMTPDARVHELFVKLIQEGNA
ncbi:MAG: pyridoxal 5'-phosphate synthase glutaminase subunit PdxT [Actinomycetota bacterium]